VCLKVNIAKPNEHKKNSDLPTLKNYVTPIEHFYFWGLMGLD